MSVPRHWRNQIPRYRLEGVECVSCGSKHFPARPRCHCGSTEFKPYRLPETGRVVTWTVIRNPPKDFERYAPYVVALVELDDGVRILTQLTDVSPEEVSKDMRVEAVFRRVKEDGAEGLILYGYKFRPVFT